MRLRSSLITISLLGLGIVPAMAEEPTPGMLAPGPMLAQVPPPPPPPMVWAPSWTGFYLGANVGGATGSDSFRYSPPLPVGTAGALRSSSGDFNYRGPFGGGTAGYNWQFNPTWVWGLEGDMDAAGISGGVNCGPGVLIHCSLKNTWIGTVRGRLGWTPGGGNSLWYVTGGAAFGDVTVSAPGVNHGATNTGWTAGAGFEYMFSPQWSVKVEYRHVDLGDISTSIPATLTGLGVAATSRVNYNTDGALLGVNYHFNAPPPPPPIVAPAPPPVAPKVFIVFFDWDKDTITPEGQAIIQQAADAWRSGAPVQIQVTGYTDRSGSAGYNQRLSERRANNVARAMAALGVPKASMIVSGRGENDNRVPTANGVREPQNRRVEIVSP